ncbi:LON peptidase substrate-binding domain-containing protein [Streptomonospora wellingtoniae]|uniref:LON peptidase substrate-binding domain-containing protein n=1 Tax=Streptomonospora wellingtoniae TaxID=3075544 RepID=A0ABU2KPW0_9ACTN|nr:LON peptidase substrate-binding domain-containing protein [Streptomonospora sp. DSM 45055]MDT0301183.1 LON peptidase substrate-binding domain-containing protein [Streptomonospora sp. DSM 45055]
MPHRLPLFPLNSVLFPGARLPLRVFEERYRRLMGDVLDDPGDAVSGTFGVVGIELGHEVGEASAQLAHVGCTAEVRTARRHADGTFDVVVEGGSRFRVDSVENSGPKGYLRAETTFLPDEVGEGADDYAERVGRLFGVYCERLRGLGVAAEPPRDFPSAPLPLSYTVAATMVVDQGDKQRLLEADHAAQRLQTAAVLLRRENRVLTSLPVLPAEHLPQPEVSLN